MQDFFCQYWIQNLEHQKNHSKLLEKPQRKRLPSQGLNVVPQFFGAPKWRWENMNKNYVFSTSTSNNLQTFTQQFINSFISQALSLDLPEICSKVHRGQGVEAFKEFLCQGWIYRSHRRTKDLGAIEALVHPHLYWIIGIHFSGKRNSSI